MKWLEEMSCNFYIKQNLYCLRRNIANSASEMIFRFSRSFLLLTTCSPKFEVSFIQDTSSALANFNVTCRVVQLKMFFPENVARSASEMHKVYLISLQVKVSFIQDKLCTCRFQCNLQLSVWPASPNCNSGAGNWLENIASSVSEILSSAMHQWVLIHDQTF